MNVTGETMIFKNDLGFSTTISQKKQNGSYENMYISVQFKKDDTTAQNISNMTKIDVKNGFLSFYKTTAGLNKIKLVVTEYDIVNENKPTQEKNEDDYKDPFESIPSNMEYPDDDLPF